MLGKGELQLHRKGFTKRVLIVEDDPVSALLLRRVLEQRGYQVDQACNGITALETFQQNRHGIVISDWMMPEMDGIAFTKQLRQMSGQYVYVILLSAKGQREDRLEAFEAGVDDFLTKPLDRDDLYARLKVAERILSAEESLRMQKEELKAATERLKVANQNLQIASQRFEELFTGLPAACFTFDAEGLVHEWNRAAENLFGISAHQSILREIWQTFGGRDSSFWSKDFVHQVFTGSGPSQFEWSYSITEEEVRHLMCSVFVLRGTSGDIIGAISANIDISEQRKAHKMVEEQKKALEEVNEKLAKLAVTDGLTGLWNHRRFREEIEVMFATHKRKQNPMSLIFLDVDHFKSYNDTYGHPAGDEVLKKVALILRENARFGEAVARYGGEEFAVILPDTSAEEALQAAERFRTAIESNSWPLRAVTVSLGVATLSADDAKVDEVLEKADIALYAAKNAGRNRAMHFENMGEHKTASQHQGIKKLA
jgi:two-component system cell cycle response regulator